MPSPFTFALLLSPEYDMSPYIEFCASKIKRIVESELSLFAEVAREVAGEKANLSTLIALVMSIQHIGSLAIL